jgi:hypothetical protein
MPSVSEAVNRLRFEVTTTGAEQSAAQLGRVAVGHDTVATAAVTASRSMAGYEAQVAAIQKRQEAYTAAIVANTAALTSSNGAMVAANDNAARSFAGASIEAASMANHVKLVGEAAYAFSPAFREVVNGLAAPALRGASVALVAVAGGIVTATNLAGTGLVRLGASAALASTSLTPVAGVITSAGLAMQAFNPSIAGVATSILSKFLPALRLLGAVGIIVNAAKMVGDAWQLGGQQLERYRQIAEDAAKVDLSTTYFQKLTKGAEAAKLPVDALTAALTTLQKQSADQLGGSAVGNRLAASVKVGNFTGNTGVQEYAQANTTQQRYEAIVSLIHQAMEAGQRLAALDIAGTAFGPEAADNLRKDSEYFDKLNAAAAKISDAQLVSPEDVRRAIDLQTRYDAAVKILETRWHPIQDLLTQAGIEFHANWVATVETIAQGVDWATKLVMKLGDVPTWFQKKINEGSQWIIDNTTTPESRKTAETSYGITSDPTEMAKGTDSYAVAVNKLRAGLQDQAEQQRKVSEANTIAQKTLGDTSHQIDNLKKKTEEAADAYDRALESVTKHTARMQADTLAIGLGAGALEEYRARAQLTTAAQLAGREPTAALTAEIEKQAKAAGEAGRALAFAKAQSSANFSSQTMFMSQSDLAAAQVMHNLHGDEWQSHMDDALAKQIKMNDLTKQVGDAAVSLGENLIQAFASGKTGIDAMLPALNSFGSALTKIGADSLKSGISGMLKGLGTSGFDPASLGIGAVGMGISLISNMLTQQEADATAAAKVIQEAADRAQGYMDRIRKASIDTSTLLGELQSFDVDAERQRAEEAKNGTRNLLLLEQTLAAERTAIAEKGLKDAQKQFDALVQGAKSATTESIKSLTDATTNLATALTVLGKGIVGLTDDVAAAVTKLQADFAAGLIGKINEAYGASYLTQIAGLIRQRASDMTDAANLGISPALVDLAFKSQVQKTIDDAQLTGVAFQQVLAAFPALTGQVHEFTAAAADTTSTLQQTITSLTDFIGKTEDFRKSLLVDNTLSTLSPADRLAESQRQYRDTLAAANGGDATAQGNLQGAATTYLNQAKSFYASSTQYAAIFSEVQSSLLSAETAAQQQINYAAAQVSWLQQQTQIQQQQLNWLISLNTAVSTLSSAIANPAATTPAAQGVNAAAVTAVEAAKTWHYPTVDPYLYGDKGDWTESHRALFRSEHPEARYLQGGLITNGIWNQDSLRALMPSGNSAQFAGGEYIMPAPQTARNLPQLEAMRSGNDNDSKGRNADWQEIVRGIKQVVDISDERMSRKFDELLDALDATPAKTKDALRQLVAASKSRAS